MMKRKKKKKWGRRERKRKRSIRKTRGIWWDNKKNRTKEGK